MNDKTNTDNVSAKASSKTTARGQAKLTNADALLRIDEALKKKDKSDSKKEAPAPSNRELLLELAEGMFYSYPAYWVEASDGTFIKLDSPGFYRRIKRRIAPLGLSEADAKAAFDEVAHLVQHEQNIHAVGEYAGFPAGLHRSPKNQRVLVPKAACLPEPAKGTWQSIKDLIVGLLGDEQAEYLLGYLAVFARHLYGIRADPGRVWLRQPLPAIVVAGPAACGKTLLSTVIAEIFGGRTANPYANLIGKTNFNGDLASAEVLVIDDQAADPSPAARAHLATGIKALLFANETRIEAKYHTAINIPKHSLLMFCVNDEPESLMVLPTVDESLHDKIALFKASKPETPYPTQPDHKRAHFDSLIAEIPCLLHFLLNEHAIRSEISQHRTGVACYHHPDLIESIKCLEPQLELLEFILEYFKAQFAKNASPNGDPVRIWHGKASKLQDSLEKSEAVSKSRLRQLLKYPTSMGNYLSTLNKTHQGIVRRLPVGRGTRSYEIWLCESDYTAQNVEIRLGGGGLSADQWEMIEKSAP